MLLSLYISGLDFKVNFSISANFGIQTLFLNFKKTLFELRSFCNRFLRCIYLDTYTELEQIMFQVALVNLFSLCILETFTTLSSAHVITKTPGKYSQPAKLCNTLYHCTLYLSKPLVCIKGKPLKVTISISSHNKWPWSTWYIPKKNLISKSISFVPYQRWVPIKNISDARNDKQPWRTWYKFKEKIDF